MNDTNKALIICAHPDDEIFGVGGTIAALTARGVNFSTIIFSYGEKSHPWMKETVTIETRKEESLNASKIVGSNEVYFIGLEEGKFKEQIYEDKAYSELKRLIKQISPQKIFTHSLDDPHPDHRCVYDIVTSACDDISYEGELLLFDVWNPFNLRMRSSPRLYIDITDHFQKKLDGLSCFKSQKMSIISLLWSVYLRALVHGFFIKKKYAERFIKAR